MAQEGVEMSENELIGRFVVALVLSVLFAALTVQPSAIAMWFLIFMVAVIMGLIR